MSVTSVTHTGSACTFSCSLLSWNMYEDLIRLYCSGRTVQTPCKGGWKDVDNPVERDLHLYRIKPKKAFLEGGHYSKRK